MNKKILVTSSSIPSYKEYCDEIKDLFNSRWLTNYGTKYKQLQNKIIKYLDVKNVVLYSNGHSALEGALESYNFIPGSEVITTPFTFASTVHAIVRKNLVPVFCDIRMDDYTIDVSKIEKLITKKTVAIMPVHVYGNMCDVEGIQRIAKKYGLKVIYDAAHAFGVKYKNKSSASYGDISMFSFHATKVFNTIEGGCLTFKDKRKYKTLLDLQNFGIRGPEEVRYVGGNSKMNEFCAAMGLCNLKYINKWIKQRKHVVDTYNKRLSNVKGIILQTPQKNVSPNYSYYPVVFDNYKYTRDEVFKKLEKNNIYARKYFYPIATNYECYKNMNVNSVPNAEFISKRILTLPLYPDLSDDDVNRICDIILK